MRTIFENLLALLNQGEDAVLVTVAAARGSTPRGPGSQLLAGREGLAAGTIGGGPGEAQVLLLAAELLKEKRSALRRLELRQSWIPSAAGSRRRCSSSSPMTAPPGGPWPGRPWSGWSPAGAAGWPCRRRKRPPCWRRARRASPGTGGG